MKIMSFQLEPNGGVSSPQSLSLAAFGDFNSDKNLDLFVRHEGSGVGSVFLWQPKTLSFDANSTGSTRAFAHTVPCDFDRDGHLDLLFLDTNSWTGRVEMAIQWGGPNNNDGQLLNLPSASAASGFPFVVDFDGSMSASLLGFAPDSTSLSLWRIFHNRTASVSPAMLSTNSSAAKPCTSFSSPHSNAFVDLDGDCRPDLFLMCADPQTKRPYFQIWTNSLDNGFSFATQQYFNINENIGPVSFADFDADGTMDMMFVSCDANDPLACYLNVYYNTQIPLCGSTFNVPSSKFATCRSLSNLCTPDPFFSFMTSVSKIPLRDILPTLDESVDAANIPHVRIGDYDRDGFPDVLLVTTIRKSQTFVRLLQSVACGVRMGGCRSLGSGDRRRGFMVVGGGAMDEINGIPDVKVDAVFFDLYEDGTLDILCTFRNQQTNRNRILAFKNNIYADGFFLKALVLNGVCTGWCPGEERFPDPKPYGVNYFGCTFKYTVTDSSGIKHAVQLSQLPQSSYLALDTPYVFTGLGRTNNYIESLFVGTSIQHAVNVAIYYGVIPNSQLIIVPYDPDHNGPSDWSLELFINPSKHAPWVFVSLLSTLIGLSGIVLFLHMLERREDEAERKTNIHHINFDAL